jgi:ADP-heptose:LPS heptosyltransferase
MKILLVRLRLIGDVVFTTPLIRALRRQYPHAHLAYVVEPAAAPVLQGNPHLNELIVIPKRSGIARWHDDVVAARRVRREGYDVAIDLHGGPRGAWLTWASRAPMRVGYAIPGRAWMYTHLVERAPDLSPRHSVVNQWDLLEPLGIHEPDPARDALEMPVDAAMTSAVDRRLQSAGISSAHVLAIVHVSAGNPFRRWPEASFVDLLVGLATRDEYRRILVTSGPSDSAAARRIADAARLRLGPAAVQIPDIGEFSLTELRALAERSAVYIGGDSGPLHIAGTSRIPIVALLGPTLRERSMPWRDSRWYAEAVDAGPLPCRPCDQRRCAPGDFRCLTTITPQQVLDAAERAMVTELADG